jgi:Arc/MetJ-type ribon-helix-helix transcriptional regulator
MDDGERVTLRLKRAQLEQLDLLVSLGEFDDRSSAIRQAIRELIDARRAKAIAKVDEMARLQTAASTATRADEVLRK